MAEDISELQLRITEDSTSAINALDNLVTALGKVRSAVSRGMNFENKTGGISKLAESLQRLTVPEENISRLERLAKTLERIKALGNVKTNLSIGGRGKNVEKILDSVTEPIKDAQIGTDIKTDIEGAAAQMDNVKAASEGAAESTKELNHQLKETARVAKHSKGAISGITSAFGRIAFYRMIRSAIKAITEGFKTGINDVYEYSKAIGSGFAGAMDAAKASVLQMKNSLGAALAPALMSLIPILQTVVNWVIMAANAINQFLALLRGQSTWTRATAVSADALDKVKASASGAGSAIKGLLADWDELNIIQSQSGGGGGGGGGYLPIDYENMFEEVGKFDSLIRDAVNWIKNNFDAILPVVEMIGATILAWDISKHFGGVIGQLANLALTGLVISIVWKSSTEFINKYLETGDDGYLLKDMLVPALGAALAGRAVKQLAGNSPNGARFAMLAVALTLAVSATADIVALIGDTDVDALDPKSIKTALESGGKLGVGIALALNKMTDLGAGRSILAGAGAMMLWAGVATGIKAVVGYAEAGDFTPQATVDALKKSAVGAFAAGLGAGTIALAVTKSLAIAGLAAGGVAAGGFIAAAIAIGVVAKINADKNSISWGTKRLTNKEIQEFVEKKLLPVNVNANINLLKGAVDTSQFDRSSLESTVASMVPPINTLRLGLDVENSLSDLKTAVFGDGESGAAGLIGQFKDYAKGQKNLIETTLSIVPIKDNNGKDISGEYIQKSIEGWDLLTSEMDRLGQEMSNHLSAAFDTANDLNMRESEAKLAADYAEMMRRITMAVTSGETQAKGEYDFGIKLKDMDKKSFTEATSLYIDRIKEIEKSEQDALLEVAYSFRGQMAGFLEAADLATDPEIKAMYTQKAEEFGKLADEFYSKATDGLSEATKEYREKAAEQFREWIREAVGDTTSITNIPLNAGGIFADEAILRGGGYKSGMQALVESITGIPKDVLKAIDTSGWEFLGEQAREKVVNALLKSYDPETVSKILETAGIEYTKAFDIPEKLEMDIDDVDSFTEGSMAMEEAMIAAREASSDFEQVRDQLETPITVAAADDTDFINNLSNTTTETEGYISRIVAAFNSLNNIRMTFAGGLFGSSVGASVPHYAEGGMVTTGQMFIARESGPELVGSMGNKTAVANNNQIVTGITAGVSQGQAEQNALLRQQNDYLRRILAKESTVKVEPSAGWGKFNRRSEEMYARNAGV